MIIGKCIVIRGPAGSGKTTLAKMIKGNILKDAILLNCDNLREKEFGKDAWQKEYKIKIVEEISQIAMRLIKEGKNVIIDDVFEYPEQIELLQTKIPDAQWIALECSLENCIQRDKDRIDFDNKKTDTGYCGAETIKYLYPRYLWDKNIPNEIKIITDNKDSNEILMEVEKKLGIDERTEIKKVLRK